MNIEIKIEGKLPENLNKNEFEKFVQKEIEKFNTAIEGFVNGETEKPEKTEKTNKQREEFISLSKQALENELKMFDAVYSVEPERVEEMFLVKLRKRLVESNGIAAMATIFKTFVKED